MKTGTPRRLGVLQGGKPYTKLLHSRLVHRPVMDPVTGLPKVDDDGVVITRPRLVEKGQMISPRRMLRKQVQADLGLKTGRQWVRWYRANRAAFDAMLRELVGA